MTRTIRWIFLLGALIACIVWSDISIHHLLQYSTNEQQRFAQYGSIPQYPSERIKQIESIQKQWGRQCLLSVACSIFFSIAVALNWVLDGKPKRREGIKK